MAEKMMSMGLTMATLFPRAEYAEDQRYPYSILTLHCLHRGFTSGAILGIFPPLTRSLITTVLRRPPPSNPLLPYTTRLLSSTAIGTIAGTALTGIGMVGRMWGREEVEWQDRSWRILASRGQNREDAYSFGGMVLGAAVGVWRMRGAKVPGWRVVVGGAGLGSVVGTVVHVLTSSFAGGEGEGGVERLEKKVEAGAGPLKPE